MIMVRPAEPKDAAAAVDVLRRSITQLCKADHRDDPDTLAAWLSNKTPENFLSWLENVDSYCVVAEADDALAGVALLHRSGEINLLYLAPGAQRRGIGNALHAALEKRANAWCVPKLCLESTALACPFYEALGYRRLATAGSRFGVPRCHAYEKTLRPDA